VHYKDEERRLIASPFLLSTSQSVPPAVAGGSGLRPRQRTLTHPLLRVVLTAG
jgi:hypothetical protein